MILLRAPGSRHRPVPMTYHTRGPRAGEWELLADFTDYDAERNRWVTVLRGFGCDLASVPRIVWPLIAPFELSVIAPLFHDALHRHGGVSGRWLRIAGGATYVRSESDRWFRTHMIQEEVPRWRREPAYRVVRLLGRSSWQKAA